MPKIFNIVNEIVLQFLKVNIGYIDYIKKFTTLGATSCKSQQENSYRKGIKVC